MNTFIEIHFSKLFNIFFELFKRMFCSIIDEKIKIISKEEKFIAQSKDMKEKKMHVNSMRLNSMKLVHFRKIVTRVTFLHFIYVVVCLIANVIIKDIKIKTIFDNETEISCMFKRLIDAVQLFIHQNINIIIINIINERARFFDICETILININGITILISAFVVKRSDYELFLKRRFQCDAHESFININDELFKIILDSLNEKKRVNLLKMFAEHVNKRKLCLR